MLVLPWWFASILVGMIKCELFTSSSHLQNLLSLEETLVVHLKKYLADEEARLARLKIFYEQIRHIEHVDRIDHVKHPVNAYLLVKRLYVGWESAVKSARVNNAVDLIGALSYNRETFPTSEDVEGAQDALLRLQETYNLLSREISEGFHEYRGSSATKLSADDAFLVGKRAYEGQYADVTESWMRESLRLLENGRLEGSSMRPTKIEIFDYLAWIEYKNGKADAALNHTLEMLKIDPYHERARRNEPLFRQMSEKQKTNASSEEIGSNAGKKNKFPKFNYSTEEDDYSRYLLERSRAMELCRGETEPAPRKLASKLVCWYKTDHPLTRIKPAKVERVFVKPELLFFRGAMSDYEIERVKFLASPILSRATVHNPRTGKIEHADYRTSKSAWLDETDDPLVESMSKRIEAYTGLTMDTAEKLQVANYGIGGHYDAHFDFGRQKNSERANGNRIATMLFYMSNVERGGATVFTNIGQAIFPSKGDAVFWYNLHPDGTGDFDTRHAACPVLIGEKWVSNRWIHERGQEFRRPCNLVPDTPIDELR